MRFKVNKDAVISAYKMLVEEKLSIPEISARLEVKPATISSWFVALRKNGLEVPLANRVDWKDIATRLMADKNQTAA